MKKLLVLMLACLLLTGCGTEPVQEVPDATPEASGQQVPEAVGLYAPDSWAEIASCGAVRAYPLGDSNYVDIRAVGRRVLVVNDASIASLLQGAEGEILATASLELPSGYAPVMLQTNAKTIAYYAPEPHQVVLMDDMLQELSRIDLPEGIIGNPSIHLEQQEIFYCLGNEIRALNMQTGISRLVRTHSGQTPELLGSYFNDNVLGCRITDEQGNVKIHYLYTQNGQVIHTDSGTSFLLTLGQDYFAMRDDDTTRQVLFGNADGETMCLNVEAENLLPALALGGTVQYQAVDGDLHLQFYDFASGHCSAKVSIPDADAPLAFCADEDYLWLLCDKILYRWEVAASPTSDETLYADNLYTAEDPDREGLALCSQRATEIGETYGITIRIWEDAENGTYPVETEYQVSVIRSALDSLEQTLSILPEGFLNTTGALEVDLVRSVIANRESVQIRAAGGMRMVIPCENAQWGFLHGLGWAVDTRVLGNSRDYDFWDELNPEGFTYVYTYDQGAGLPDADLYANAFVDETAMRFPTEDRARIFAAAVLPGNEHLFAGEALQNKLAFLCGAVREAYGLDDSTEVLPWEQYLAEPLA